MDQTDFDLDELMSEEFLNDLDNVSARTEVLIKPDWVVGNESHTSYRSWEMILELKKEKEKNIKNYGKIANEKTPKSLYQITKSEVAKSLGVSAQSIFRMSKFSPMILGFFDETNSDLLKSYGKEQLKQRRRQMNTGIRAKKKDLIVKIHQDIDKELSELKAKTTKDVLDLAVDKIPLDLKVKLGL
ncbi:hypothetical protein AB4359_13530 [Vibrio splendidus]